MMHPHPDDLPSTANSWISQYTVSYLPSPHPLMNPFAVRVQNAGNPNEWLVITGQSAEVWSRPDKVSVSYRIKMDDPIWRDKYVHTLVNALNLAWGVAAIYTINGRTASQVLAQEGDSTDAHISDDHGTVGPKHLDDAPRGAEETLAASFAGPDRPGRHRRD